MVTLRHITKVGVDVLMGSHTLLALFRITPIYKLLLYSMKTRQIHVLSEAALSAAGGLSLPPAHSLCRPARYAH